MNKHYVLRDVDKIGNRITVTLEQRELVETGGYNADLKTKTKKVRLVFNRPDDTQNFFDILTMGIQQIEVLD